MNAFAFAVVGFFALPLLALMIVAVCQTWKRWRSRKQAPTGRITGKMMLLAVTLMMAACATPEEMRNAQQHFFKAEAAAATGDLNAQMQYELLCYLYGVPPRVGFGRGPNPFLPPLTAPQNRVTLRP